MIRTSEQKSNAERSAYADLFGRPALRRRASAPRHHPRPQYLDAYRAGQSIVGHFEAHPIETLHGVLDALYAERGGEQV